MPDSRRAAKSPLWCHAAKPCQSVKGSGSRLFNLDRLVGLCIYKKEHIFEMFCLLLVPDNSIIREK